MAQRLREKGEIIPPTWVDGAEKGLRTGSMRAFLSPSTGEIGGLILVNPRPKRLFCHLHLTRWGSVDREGHALVHALLQEPPPEHVHRLDLTFSSQRPEQEGALAALISKPEFLFRVVERQKMSRSLSATSPPEDAALPPGFSFRGVHEFSLETMAGLDFQAFEASPDRGLVASDLDEDTRIMREMLEGELGPLMPVASPTVIRDAAPEVPVAFLLSIRHGPRSALIADVAVSPEMRGRGVGRAILARALRGLIASGVTEAVLWVTRSNQIALGLYAKAGFALDQAEPIFVREFPESPGA